MYPNEDPKVYERKQQGKFPRYEDSTGVSNLGFLVQQTLKGKNPLTVIGNLFS